MRAFQRSLGGKHLEAADKSGRQLALYDVTLGFRTKEWDDN